MKDYIALGPAIRTALRQVPIECCSSSIKSEFAFN